MARSPAETVYQNALAHVYALIRGSEYARAIAEMTQAGCQRLAPAFRHDGNHSWYVIGDAFFKMGDFAMAAQAFRRALRCWPGDGEALMALGNSYSETQRPKLAARCFRKAIPLSPKRAADCRFNLGNALFDMQNYEAAAAEYAAAAATGGKKTAAKARKMLARLGVDTKGD